MTCSHEQHNIFRADPERMRAECKFVAVSDGDGWDLLELYNCPVCRSTLAIKGIGPEKETESDVMQLIEEARMDEQTEECVYCNAEVQHRADVPATADDETWVKLANEHDPSCEWIATRAHRLLETP